MSRVEDLGKEMKKILDTKNWNERYEHLVNEVMSNDYVKAFIGEHSSEISQEILDKSYTKLYEFVQERRKYEAGDSSMIAPGYEPTLFLNYRSIDVTYVPTPELLAKQEEEALKKRVKVLDIPKDVREASLDHFELTPERKEALQATFGFISNYRENHKHFHQGLYLQGSFGVGKSYLLGALANELAQYGFQTTLVHFPTFAVEMKQAIGNNTLADRMEEVKKAPILMIDDIGADSLSAWIRDDVLGVILQYRMQEQLSTFFSSNLDMKQLENEHLRLTQRGDDEPLKAKRIMERIRYLSKEIKMVGNNRRY